MKFQDLRQKFLGFFKEKGHVVIPSASLVPENDPSVLFTTAGMQQFKSYYAKPENAPSGRVTSVQLCVRTSDIDEVGDDTHLTLFEMLGNFSFGYAKDGSLGHSSMKNSYFKKEAIEMAWEFLVEVLKINIDRISTTYFEGGDNISADDESYQLLKEITGLPKNRIKGAGKSETFWGPTGNEGPCGPTVEFYVDGIEIWNLVFNQYYCKDDQYTSLEFLGVDTGMGLERLLVVYNKLSDVYETDLFQLIIKKIEEISGKKYDKFIQEFRIIADHIKAAVFIISDGVVPSNKDRGYVVRRLIRRAIVKGHELGITENFTTKLAEAVFNIYDQVYFGCPSEFSSRHSERSEESSEASMRADTLALDPSAAPQDDKKKRIIEELEKEETKFRQTLKNGLLKMNIISNMLVGWDGDLHKLEVTVKELFDLYQSEGFPWELSIEELKRKNASIQPDLEEKIKVMFDNYYEAHQKLSRTASAGMFKGGLAQDGGEAVIQYHTAAHLLLAALREVLGAHVVQRGSNITAERLRLDFSHSAKMTAEQIKKVEDLVNHQIEKDLPVTCEEMTVDEAKKSGATGVFEHKYGDRVKVYTIGPKKRGLSPKGTVPEEEPFSKEICGGPHVSRTGELGRFKITKEEASSAGVRRIKAILE